jgi:uncharacterized membrane protein
LIPLIVLFGTFLLSLGIGAMGCSWLNDWHHALIVGLAVMFSVTASAHWGARRTDLVRMVPPRLPFSGGLVTITGLLEAAGACGLLISWARPSAAVGLAILLVLMLPANVYAAHAKLSLGGRPAMRSLYRIPLQLLFISCLIAVV